MDQHTHIIKQPLITEKTLSDTKLNRYTFLVDKNATKGQVAQAVEAVFKVDVVSIRTSKIKGVARHTGRRRLPTTTKTRKKAIVELKKGQSIKVFETTG